MGHWKKSLRYLRWTIKAAFLLLFTVPFTYIPPSSEWSAPMVPAISLFFPAIKPVYFLPIIQSPCSVFLNGYSNIEVGAWLLCPLGGVQSLLSGRVEAFRLVPLIVAILIVIVLIVLLGNVFLQLGLPHRHNSR